MTIRFFVYFPLFIACFLFPWDAEAQENGSELKAEREVRELREEMRREITDLRLQLARRDAQIDQLRAALSKNAETPVVAETVSSPAATSNTVVAAEKPAAKPPTLPDGIQYKGITIKPVGFIAMESVYRSRALASDLATPYNSIPYNGAGMAHVSEWYPSARQSRFGLLLEKKAGGLALRGYLEGDFASAGTTSNNNLTNSYTLRLRQAWLNASAANGWSVSAGQMFHLATENTRGTTPLSEALPLAIDINQHAGFTWGRQVSLRVSKKVNDTLSFAGSVEEAQTLFNATNAPNNFFLGSAGTAAGLYNPLANYSANPSPDFIGKMTIDLGRAHYEAGGLLRIFRDRYYPGNAPAQAQNHTEPGGGFFVSARVPVGRFTLGAKTLMGSGVGRYGASLLPDTTVRYDGTIQPIHNAQGFLQARYAWSPRLDLVAYGGVEYAQRTYTRNPVTGQLVGYAPPSMVNTGCGVETLPSGNTGFLPGTPANCAGSTRSILSGTVGFQRRFYEGPHGRLQYQLLYTYLSRTAWAGVGGAPTATNNMVFTGFRYVLP